MGFGYTQQQKCEVEWQQHVDGGNENELDAKLECDRDIG